jgi:threonine/homoserine/homoserine lactone efflux protein
MEWAAHPTNVLNSKVALFFLALMAQLSAGNNECPEYGGDY